MIALQDRSGWFGASDTAQIMRPWTTKTFAKWWAEKLGITHSRFTTPAMRAGTYYEHRILDAIGIRTRDRQIKIRSLHLRVNLDGEDKTTVYEVKTHKGDFKVTKAYREQCQVEMYASKKKCVIVAYRLTEDDYTNYFNQIDPAQITYHEIEYDADWIKNEYLPRLRTLRTALRERRLPRAA